MIQACAKLLKTIACVNKAMPKVQLELGKAGGCGD